MVKNVDMKKDSITLSDGKVYILTEGFEAETFKAGEKVAILFHGKGGRLFATSVKQLKSPKPRPSCSPKPPWSPPWSRMTR